MLLKLSKIDLLISAHSSEEKFSKDQVNKRDYSGLYTCLNFQECQILISSIFTKYWSTKCRMYINRQTINGAFYYRVIDL